MREEERAFLLMGSWRWEGVRVCEREGGGSEKKHRVFSERVPIFLGDAIFPRGYH